MPAHGVGRIVRRELGGALLEDLMARRSGRIEREICQFPVDVAVESNLASPGEATVEDSLAFGIEDRAGIVVERGRAVEIALADRGFDGAGVEVGEAAADPGVGLRCVPAAALGLIAQLVHRRAAELPQVTAILPRRCRVLVQAGEAVGDALVVDFHRGALRQPADGAGRPVEAGLDHRFQDAALARADGLGQRPLLQLL